MPVSASSGHIAGFAAIVLLSAAIVHMIFGPNAWVVLGFAVVLCIGSLQVAHSTTALDRDGVDAVYYPLAMLGIVLAYFGASPERSHIAYKQARFGLEASIEDAAKARDEHESLLNTIRGALAAPTDFAGAIRNGVATAHAQREELSRHECDEAERLAREVRMPPVGRVEGDEFQRNQREQRATAAQLGCLKRLQELEQPAWTAGMAVQNLADIEALGKSSPEGSPLGDVFVRFQGRFHTVRTLLAAMSDPAVTIDRLQRTLAGIETKRAATVQRISEMRNGEIDRILDLDTPPSVGRSLVYYFWPYFIITALGMKVARKKSKPSPQAIGSAT